MGELARELGTVVGGVNTLELGRASGLPRSTFRESICQWCLAQWFKKFLFCFVSFLYLWQGSKIRRLAGLDKTFFFYSFKNLYFCRLLTLNRAFIDHSTTW